MRAMLTPRRAPETQLRKQLVQFGRLCYERHLLVGLDGNLSVRLTDSLVLATRAGVHKGLMTADDLVVVDLSGRKLRGQGRPTSEMAMHLACYRERPDIEAVVHAHPPTAVAFTIAGLSLARCVLPEVVLTLGTIPTLPYATTGTEDLAEEVAAAATRHDALLLDRHGAVCLGTSVEEAFCKLETLEHLAIIMKAARDLGRIQDLPAEEAAHLRRMGLARYGGPPAAVAVADAPMADLPDACRACSGCGNPRADGLAPPAGFSVARLTRG